jgi:hypothetical protein
MVGGMERGGEGMRDEGEEGAMCGSCEGGGMTQRPSGQVVVGLVRATRRDIHFVWGCAQEVDV